MSDQINKSGQPQPVMALVKYYSDDNGVVHVYIQKSFHEYVNIAGYSEVSGFSEEDFPDQSDYVELSDSGQPQPVTAPVKYYCDDDGVVHVYIRETFHEYVNIAGYSKVSGFSQQDFPDQSEYVELTDPPVDAEEANAIFALDGIPCGPKNG